MPRKTTKKHAFYNTLARYLRENNMTYRSVNSVSISVTSGYLNRIWFFPYDNRIKVVQQHLGNDCPVVSISFDIEINGSLEALFYKLHNVGLLSEIAYSKLLVNRYAKAS